MQKEVYNILIKSIPNGWNPLVSKRLADYGISSNLVHDTFDYYNVQLKGLQPHLRMSFIKTITNGWHTSSRMHEATCLPCIFGCNALPDNCLISSTSAPHGNSIRDETAHYLSCPILAGLLSQAFGIDKLINLHQLAFGNDRDDQTGALACATCYHVYHSLKFGNLPLIQSAIETGRFSLVRAFALSAARAFCNEYGIQPVGLILRICSNSGFKRRERDTPIAVPPLTSIPYPNASASQPVTRERFCLPDTPIVVPPVLGSCPNS